MASYSYAESVRLSKEIQNLMKIKRYEKISRGLLVAARTNPNPSTNAKLASEIKLAKALGFPREKIELILKNAPTLKDPLIYDSVIVEAMWHNISFVIMVETNNNARTMPQIKSIVSKNGGEVKSPNSCLSLFKQWEKLAIFKNRLSITEEELEIFGVETDAEDYGNDEVNETEEVFNFYYPRDNFNPNALIENLSHYVKNNNEVFVLEYGLTLSPDETKALSEEYLEAYHSLIGNLLELDDVMSIFDNVELA